MRLASRYFAEPGARKRFPSIDGDPPDMTHFEVGCPFARAAQKGCRSALNETC